MSFFDKSLIVFFYLSLFQLEKKFERKKFIIMGDDWKQLTKSGADLAGTGGKFLEVTPKELRKHNRRTNCWLALNGTVYNVTPYMDYHPGK